MMSRDLHRVDASMLADDRTVHVAGEFEQRRRGAQPAPAERRQNHDEEHACDTAFNRRMYTLLGVYLFAVLVVLFVVLPPVIHLAMRFGG